jgi:N-acetylglutamate synthase-like GNAT family acetyltransferase
MDFAMTVTIRRATPADCEAILAAHVASIRELCAPDYRPEEIEAWAGPKRAEDYLAPMRDNDFVVAEVRGELAGFGELIVGPAAGIPQGEAELRGLYIHPRHARQGVGRAIVAYLQEEALARGAARWFVRVTITAEPFYRRMGFISMQRETHRLRSGVEIACIRMEAALGAP